MSVYYLYFSPNINLVNSVYKGLYRLFYKRKTFQVIIRKLDLIL